MNGSCWICDIRQLQYYIVMLTDVTQKTNSPQMLSYLNVDILNNKTLTTEKSNNGLESE